MVIEYERLKDYELIRKIATNTRVYRHISDDGSPEASQWKPIESDAIWYVGVKVDGSFHGVFIFVPHNSICYEIHTCLLPDIWGRTAHSAARGLSDWVWSNMPARRVITNVPTYNRLALRFAEVAGMTKFGVNDRSFMKNGKLYDQIMLGISKPEELCH